MKVALIVGHYVNGKDKGAVNYLGETESAFNYRVCKKLQKSLSVNNVTSQIFLRDTYGSVKGVGKAVSDWKPDLSIEFHFNSFQSKAFGCEALALKDEEKSIFFADLLTDYIERATGIKQRNKEGVLLISVGGRGYTNLLSIDKNIPKVLVEPCFANIKTIESQAIFENEDNYISALSTCILAFLNNRSIIDNNKKFGVSPESNWEAIKRILIGKY